MQSSLRRYDQVCDCTIKAKRTGSITLLYNGQRKTLNLKAGQNTSVL